jgi:hypothetical protein
MFDLEKLEKLSEAKFDALFVELHKKIIENPLQNFIEAQGFVGMSVTLGQRVLIKLVMNQELDSTTLYPVYKEDFTKEEFSLLQDTTTETDLYEYFTGKIYDFSKVNKIRDISLIVGRRGGKTLIASIFAVYVAIKKNWKPLLGRKKFATILVLSQSKEFSDETVAEIRAVIEDSPILSRLLNKKAKNTFNTINLKIPFRDNSGKITYSYVRIRTNAASSKSSRGSACPAILCDEIAFWGSEMDSRETAKSIVRALKPSMLQFGREGMWIEISTPNAKNGYFYEKYERREEFSGKYLILKSPSWVFNDRYDTEEFRDEWKEDPVNFDREYRANFLQSISNFFNIASIDSAIMLGTGVIPPASKLQGVRYVCTIDSAFKGDRFTVNILGKCGNKIRQYATLGFMGTPHNPVKAFDVAKAVRTLNKSYDFDQVFADQFSFNPLKEIFSQFNLTLTELTWNNTFKQKIYKNLKYLFDSQLIDLLDHTLTVKELKELQVEVGVTGRIRIGHCLGGHDDFAASLAMGAFILVQNEGLIESNAEVINTEKTYGIQRDTNGRCFDAPPPELLSDEIGYSVLDNTADYTKDPKTGKLMRIEDLEDAEFDDMVDDDDDTMI